MRNLNLKNTLYINNKIKAKEIFVIARFFESNLIINCFKIFIINLQFKKKYFEIFISKLFLKN